MELKHSQAKPAISVAWRYPLLAAAFITMLLAVTGGLWRIGLALPAGWSGVAAWHGPLLIGGFFGTLISLERAVAINQPMTYLAPLAAAAGALLVLSGATTAGEASWLVASMVFCYANLIIFKRSPATYTLVLLLGASCWLAGNLLWWFSGHWFAALPWWCLFLVLTIAGERLELTRYLGKSAAATGVFLAITTALIGTAAWSQFSAPIDLRWFSLALAMLAWWLLVHDIARRTIRQQGQTRYIAACLLSGYVWLLLGGVIGLIWHPLAPGASYDAWLHAILLGFVMLMVFGHALVIFPAVTRIRLAYHAGFYWPMCLLQAGLLIRLAGDALGDLPARQSGAMLNALAIVLFILSVGYAGIKGRKT